MSEQALRSRPVVAIVDDEEDILTYLGMALSDHGLEVVSIADSRSALALLADASPDLICLDLLMPQQTGVALYGQLCAHPTLRTTPIVIMSGLAQRAEIQEMLRGTGELPPPAAIVEKPIDIEEFLALADGLLGRTEEASP